VRRWQDALPSLLAAGFVFTLGLWVAVFAVGAAVLSIPSVPLDVRYAVGLCTLAYFYVYAEGSRRSRPLPFSPVIFTVADAAVASTIYLLSAPYVGYAHLLLFFTVARMAARFRDIRALPSGLLLTIPFLWPQRVPAMTLVLESFAVLMLMLGVQHLLEANRRAQGEAGLQATLATIVSSLARATTEAQVLDHLAALVPPMASSCAWAFWVRSPDGKDFRAERWYGLRAGERPIANFSPELGADVAAAVEVTGPLPGSSSGESTLVQPMACEGRVLGLVTVSGQAAEWGGGRRDLIRTVAGEAALALARLQAQRDVRRQADAMETANRLGALVAVHAEDSASALEALRGGLRQVLVCETVYVAWLAGTAFELTTGSGDPLAPFLPDRVPMSGTRAAEALAGQVPVFEPVAGRRPEDAFLVPGQVRHVAVLPIVIDGRPATLEVGRREPRPFSESEGFFLRMLAERVGIAFTAGLAASGSGRSQGPQMQTRLVMES